MQDCFAFGVGNVGLQIFVICRCRLRVKEVCDTRITCMQTSLEVANVYCIVSLVPTLRTILHVYHALRKCLTSFNGNASIELTFIFILLALFIESAQGIDPLFDQPTFLVFLDSF